MTVDDRSVDQLEALEVRMAGHRVQNCAAEAPVHEVIASVDLSRLIGVDSRRGVERPIRGAVGLEKHPALGREAPSKNVEQAHRVVNPVQDPEAEDEVERLPQLVEIEGVE